MTAITLRQLAAIMHMHGENNVAFSARTYPGACHTYLSLTRRHLAEYSSSDGGGFVLTERGRTVAHTVAELIGEEE